MGTSKNESSSNCDHAVCPQPVTNHKFYNQYKLDIPWEKLLQQNNSEKYTEITHM